jgi:Zn-dependent protease
VGDRAADDHVSRPRLAVQLCTFRGTQVWLDASWVVVLPFAVWSLAVGYVPEHYPVFGAVLSWLTGLAGAAGLLAAVLLHEAVHVLVEQRNARPRCAVIVHVVGSAPYPACGGGDVSALVAGPAASLVLSALTFWAALNTGPFSRPLEALMGYLALVNALLALAHCVPAWPFDAGRLVGSVLPRCGVPSVVAAGIVRTLGALVAFGLVLFGGWQIVVLGSRFIGVWIVAVGALIAWALATEQWRRR